MINPSAIIDHSANIASDVSVGPYSVIGPNVEIDEGTWIGPHVVIQGPCRIGKHNKIYQFSSIGDTPQDKKYHDEATLLEIGDGNTIRENCTINRGTSSDRGITKIGNDNWIMAYVHIAHDCLVGNNTVFSNNASLAGHVTIEDYAILSGFTLVHQFCTIGAYSFSAMGSGIVNDVPPYVLVSGHRASPYGINTEGLKRNNFSSESIQILRQAYKFLYRSNLSLKTALLKIEELAVQCDDVVRLVDFIRSSKRGLIR